MLSSLLMLSPCSYALSESEAENIADLTAVFIFLKNDCGFQDVSSQQIRRAIVLFAAQNKWDLNNYNQFNMRARGENSYYDLSNIKIPIHKKCEGLARNSLYLLPYAG